VRSDPADHAEEFSRLWADRLKEYRTLLMDDLGIHRDLNGEPNYAGDGRWWAFNPAGRIGGNTISGIFLLFPAHHFPAALVILSARFLRAT
jgi:hypothetical protein